MAQMANCIACIEAWMAYNRLRLNPAKTEVIWLGYSRHLCTLQALLLPDASILPRVRFAGGGLGVQPSQ